MKTYSILAEGALTYYATSFLFSPIIGGACAITHIALSHLNEDKKPWFPLEKWALCDVKNELIDLFNPFGWGWKTISLVAFNIILSLSLFLLNPPMNQLAVTYLTQTGINAAELAHRIFLICVQAPIIEEIFFRGFLQQRIGDIQALFSKTTETIFHKTTRIVLQALYFAKLHYSSLQTVSCNVAVLMGTFAYGLYWGDVKERHGHLWTSTALHTMNNTGIAIRYLV